MLTVDCVSFVVGPTDQSQYLRRQIVMRLSSKTLKSTAVAAAGSTPSDYDLLNKMKTNTQTVRSTSLKVYECSLGTKMVQFC